MSPLVRVALSLLFLFTFVFVFVAQDLDDVTISGKITDPNGLAVAGATVTATHIETGQIRTITSDDKGMFQIVKARPGTYKVKVENGGFAPQERTDLNTVSGQVVQLEFKLAVGSVTAQQTVNVTDEDAPAVDTTRTVVGGTITSKEIEEIPNTSRNTLDLVLTLGGTSEEQLSTSGLADDRAANPRTAPLEQGNFSISGGTAYSNNITIDGLDNNDDLTSRDRFQPSLEAIAEVQVVANQFSAEYGRASGGRVNLRTRSGGNKFRGRAFGFFRDESLNANSWHNNSRGISRPPLQEINPGFTFGGPVIVPFYNGRKRTFFFVAYEHDNFADTTLIDAFLPVGSNPHYTLPSPTGTTQFCDTTGSPAPPCPLVNGNPGSAPLSEYTKQFSTPNVSDVVTARFDHRLFNNNDLTIGFQFGRKNNKRTTGSTVTKIENAFQSKLINTEAYNLTDNQVFGAHIVNQFRTQWSHYQPSYETSNPFDPVVIVGYRDPISNSVKSLTAGNSTLSTNQNFADTRTETRWQFQDTLTYVVGRHTFKGGLDIQNVVSKVEGLGDATGTFNFGSALAYTQNTINRYRQNFGTSQDVKNKYIGVFFNDQMQLWSKVTLSAGLRYERETAVSDDNNLGPRLAVAWAPFKSNKTVFRFGTGIFYNRVLLRTVGDSIQNSGGNLVSFDSSTIGAAATDSRRTFILNAIAAAFPATYPTVADLKALVTSVCPTVPSPLGPCNANTGFSVGNVSSAGNPLRSVEAGLKIPESYQFNIGFERELFKGWVFEGNYTWNKTAFLWRDENSNAPRLPAGFADWTDYLRNHNYLFPNQNGTIRTYSFVLGATNDPSGISGNCSFTANSSCVVNLNSTSTTATAPQSTVVGSNGNVTGGPVGIALAAISQFRPDQTVSETSLIGSRGRAFYQGLILELRSRYRKLGAGFGSSVRMAYTLSSTMDDGLNNTANAEVDGDFAREWARSLQDRRHRFALSGTFDTPWWFGKLKFSPLFRYGSSAPFNLGAGGSDRNLDDLGTDRLNFSGDIKDIKYREPGSSPPDALLAQFSLQPIGSKSGNLPRNAGTGPSFFTFDLNVGREWKLTERMKLRPVLEFDNIFNAAVFSYGSEFIDFQALSTTITPTQQLARDNFLVPTRTYRQRQIRVGLRFDF